ncbi:MAG: sugar nucleotide-binding protein [Synergistaceae bacterium]|jgi:dTDP-4-dehydrorhamnose reductase|nr:sugar nucleotide-binding protein [Synergistaceae bacterium]
MIKVLLVGASSFLGHALFRGLAAERGVLTRGTCFSNHTDASFAPLDITSAPQIEKILDREAPDCILWVAGNKDLKKCQEDYDFAYRINTRPVLDLTECLARGKQKSRVLFISTDYVFDGKKGAYKDTDAPMPVTNYGKTNALAEELLLNSGVDFKIVRTAAVMGQGGQFFDWLIKSLLKNEELSLYSNVIFSPTPMNLLVQAFIDLILNYDAFQQKILHLVGDVPMSRYTFGKLVAGILGSRSVLVPSQVDFSSVLFQENLSLVPSPCMKKYNNVSFKERLADEVRTGI